MAKLWEINLVKELEKKPAIWQTNHYYHHTNAVLSECWKEISKVVDRKGKYFQHNLFLLNLIN